MEISQCVKVEIHQRTNEGILKCTKVLFYFGAKVLKNIHSHK
nr:MAG TPA: hypothetical protein [Caudoviricetes sp.]